MAAKYEWTEMNFLLTMLTNQKKIKRKFNAATQLRRSQEGIYKSDLKKKLWGSGLKSTNVNIEDPNSNRQSYQGLPMLATGNAHNRKCCLVCNHVRPGSKQCISEDVERDKLTAAALHVLRSPVGEATFSAKQEGTQTSTDR